MLKKTVLPALAATVLLSGSFVSTNAMAGDEAVIKSICSYIASDDANRVRKKLKENRLRIRDIHDAILCNGSSMLKFAAEKNSVEAGKLIAKKLSKKSLKAPGPDGVVFLDWAASNGYSSEIVDVVKGRI